MQQLTFFENLKQYVGFTDASSALLRDFRPVAAPHFQPIIDDFYATIETHPGASASITGGAAQIARLKQTLMRWIDTMLLGPHDEAYYEMRARIGRMHVRINLPQGYMFAAMSRIRVQLLEVLAAELKAAPEVTQRTAEALHQIIDLELAIMLETYREDLVAKNRNAERLATIGQFAASIGHELRNPLGVMESSLFLLRQHLGPAVATAPNVQKHLDRIAGEVKRSNKTIHDLLELARNRPPRKQKTPLQAIVTSTIDSLSMLQGIAVDSKLPPELAASVDADQIQQVLLNLFVNASQAMGGHGHIEIDGESLADGTVRIRIQDDGPGIPAEVRYRIFEALFTTKAKGSGLGLALCRRILEAHGGTIELEPSDRGASFLLTFPPDDEAETRLPG
jgi:two-component system sensor histidine kinase HydH